MATPPPPTKRLVAYGLLVACALAALLVPFVLLGQYGYVKELRWGRLAGLFLAGAGGLGAGLGLAYGAGAIKSLLANAGTRVAGGWGMGSQLGTAVAASLATAAVVVSFTQIAPQQSGFNSAAGTLNEQLAAVPDELREVLPPETPQPRTGLTDSTLAIAVPAQTAPGSPARSSAQPTPKAETPEAADVASPPGTDEADTEPLAIAEEPATKAAPPPSTQSAGTAQPTPTEREEAAPAAPPTEKDVTAKRKSTARVRYNETNLQREGVPLVLQLPVPAKATVLQVERVFATLTPRGADLQFGPQEPYIVLVGPGVDEPLAADLLLQAVRADRRVVQVTASRTNLPGWEALTVIRSGVAADGGFTTEVLLFTPGQQPARMVKLFSPLSHPTTEAAQAEAATLRLRTP